MHNAGNKEHFDGNMWLLETDMSHTLKPILTSFFEDILHLKSVYLQLAMNQRPKIKTDQVQHLLMSDYGQSQPSPTKWIVGHVALGLAIL